MSASAPDEDTDAPVLASAAETVQFIAQLQAAFPVEPTSDEDKARLEAYLAKYPESFRRRVMARALVDMVTHKPTRDQQGISLTGGVDFSDLIK